MSQQLVVQFTLELVLGYVEFSVSRDQLVLLPAVVLENFKYILAMCHQVHFRFGSMAGFWVGRLLGFSVSK